MRQLQPLTISPALALSPQASHLEGTIVLLNDGHFLVARSYGWGFVKNGTEAPIPLGAQQARKVLEAAAQPRTYRAPALIGFQNGAN